VVFQFLDFESGVAPVFLENIFLLAVQTLDVDREFLKFFREFLSRASSEPILDTTRTPVTESAFEGYLKYFRILIVPKRLLRKSFIQFSEHFTCEFRQG